MPGLRPKFGKYPQNGSIKAKKDLSSRPDTVTNTGKSGKVLAFSAAC
jgi:hypothetical protein